MRPTRPRRALPFLSCAVAAAVLALSGCGQDDAAYPRLLPLSELNRPPAIPAHAQDAAADPQAVGAALQARRAEAAARAGDARGPVADADALAGRARALRTRADALAATELPQGPTSAATSAATPVAPPEAATAARAQALRDRARALSERPVAGQPACPPGTADAAASRCNPGTDQPNPRAP
ncbi:hypothetical protein [Paracoccus luteus]|uniref:hypothetical protein n=1 Tax=Paracoccus luteus TaxID=2508543 RepID=UPI00106FE537|nr:hypothetical protein [Paracoccus luteus]